jgi:hypothetical protein
LSGVHPRITRILKSPRAIKHSRLALENPLKKREENDSGNGAPIPDIGVAAVNLRPKQSPPSPARFPHSPGPRRGGRSRPRPSLIRPAARGTQHAMATGLRHSSMKTLNCKTTSKLNCSSSISAGSRLHRPTPDSHPGSPPPIPDDPLPSSPSAGGQLHGSTPTTT